MGVFLLELLVAHGAELCAGDGFFVLGKNAKLLGDGHGGVDMVAGYHDGPDARLTALLDGGLYLRAHRIDHARQPQEAQVMLQIVGLEGGRLRLIYPLGGGQHPQSLVGHGLVGGQNLSAFFLRHGTHHTAVPIAGAALQHHVGATLGELDIAALRLMHGGHHLAAGVKGRFTHTGQLVLQTGLGQAALGAPRHQRRLGRLAVDSAVLRQRGVGAQGHGGGGAVAVGAVIVHHGHLVLGQGAGLIRADDLGAAQGLHRGQAADDGAALGHIGDADAQHHGDHGGKAFRDGGHRQRHGDHEGVQHHVQGERTGTQQLHTEDQHADHQHQLGEDAGQLGQLDLQGSLALLGVGQRVGDLAHLGIHTCLGHHHAAAAIHHGGAHVDHVLPVAQRYVAGVVPQVD